MKKNSLFNPILFKSLHNIQKRNYLIFPEPNLNGVKVPSLKPMYYMWLSSIALHSMAGTYLGYERGKQIAKKSDNIDPALSKLGGIIIGSLLGGGIGLCPPPLYALMYLAYRSNNQVIQGYWHSVVTEQKKAEIHR